MDWYDQIDEKTLFKCVNWWVYLEIEIRDFIGKKIQAYSIRGVWPTFS